MDELVKLVSQKTGLSEAAPLQVTARNRVLLRIAESSMGMVMFLWLCRGSPRHALCLFKSFFP